jgi:Ca2+-binding RTX toxin-like protein
MNADISTLQAHLNNDKNALAEIRRAATPDEALDVAARVAGELGLSITRQDIARAVAPPQGELSDAQLENVVGGKVLGWTGTDGDDTRAASNYYDNILDGGDGNDTLCGAQRNDTLSGGRGDDSLMGGGGDDYVSGGSGDDAISGGIGDDYLDGGEGDDSMAGGSGADTMEGGSGDDYMKGGSGSDVMDGGEGDDMLFGGHGNDTIDGGAGDDVLDGGAGDDVLTGGQGADTFAFTSNSGDDVVTDFTPGQDRLFFEGASSPDDLEVTRTDEGTVISFGSATVTLQGVEIESAEEVWKLTVNAG